MALSLGTTLEIERSRRKMTHYEFAEGFLGISYSHYLGLVKGVNSPKLKTVEKIASALECEAWELVRAATR